MNLNGAILPPSNSSCQFGASDTLNLINSDRNRTENIYQVSTLEEWESCNATNAVNSIPRLVTNITTLQLVAGNFFELDLGFPVFLISTSNGSEESAYNDTVGSTPCLRMVFLLGSQNIACPYPSVCDESVLSENSNLLNIGCNFDVASTTTTTRTQSPTTTNVMQTTTVSKS